MNYFPRFLKCQVREIWAVNRHCSFKVLYKVKMIDFKNFLFLGKFTLNMILKNTFRNIQIVGVYNILS